MTMSDRQFARRPVSTDNGSSPEKDFADVMRNQYPAADPELVAILSPALSDIDSPAYDAAHRFVADRMNGLDLSRAGRADARQWPSQARALMAHFGVPV